jgi:hypothetical protein
VSIHDHFCADQPKRIERVDYDGIEQRVQTCARRDAALSGDVHVETLNAMADRAIEYAASFVLNVKRPTLPAFAIRRFTFRYFAAFFDAKAQRVVLS